MKLLSLNLQAFGPYLEPVVVDFRSLRFSRLFLIHGPVGSGKTFLLDGICFSLYGRSSGGERESSGLRHLGAPLGMESSAILDFEVQNQAYRVERRLAGDDALVNEEVTLWRLPEFGNPTRRDILSATASGVAQMVEKLLGLNAEQFCQVAILPQGRFRRFLLAEGDDRRRILANIFNSERHARFQELLARSAQDYKQNLENCWRQREELIERYQDLGGGPRECLNRSTEELSGIEDDCKSHHEKSAEWERSLEEAVRYEILDRQRDMSERELDVLRSETESPQEALTERLKKALPEFEQWKKLVERAEGISAELHEQRTQYEQLKSGTNFLEAEVERARLVEEERFNLGRSLERLEQLSQESEGARVLANEVLRVEESLKDLAHRRSELATQVKSWKADIESIKQELEKIAAAESKLEGLRKEIERASELRAKLKQSEALEEAYQQAQQREERFEDLVEDLEEERRRLKKALSQQKEREFEDALQVLKKSLKREQECPLCGSLEHPKPFNARRRRRRSPEEDSEQLQKIKQKLELARRELGQASERTSRLKGRLEERAENMDSNADIDEQTLAQLSRTVQAVEVLVGRKDGLQKELKELKQLAKPARSKLKKMRLLRERLQSSLDAVSLQQRERQKGVESLAGELLGRKSLSQMDELHHLIDLESLRLKQQLQELEEVTFTTERAELMAETFALQLAETRASEKRREELTSEAEQITLSLRDQFRMDFADWDDLSFTLSRLSRESSVATGEDPVLDRETLIHTVERQLRQSVELLSTLPRPEMKADQIRSALNREREQLELKVGRRAALKKGIERSSEDVRSYDNLVEQIRELEFRSNCLNRLSTLAEGAKGVNFHDWYLTKVFRQVIDAANLRLEVLAPNRFCLSLEDGLEVTIVDFQASKQRSATTLSGGESFLASLALALGLGDVLQSERDSRERLQTLFIDEGFGYLDRRALEAALDCLESLKQEGRAVGIISHVAQLRERIRAQIVVASNDAPLPYGMDRIQVFTE